MDHLLTNSGSASTLPDFGDEAVRRRLGPAALIAFSKMMGLWRVSGEKACHLLALAPETNLDVLDPEQLGQEQLLRISYMLGIYEALHTLHGDELADEWITLPNSNALFGGQTPLVCMIDGGIDVLRSVRRLLDGRCQGK